MLKPVLGAEALKALFDELQTQVNDLMSEHSAFNEDLAYLKLGGPRSPYDTTSTKISRNTRSATLRVPKYMSFEDQLHQIRIRLKDKKSQTDQIFAFFEKRVEAIGNTPATNLSVTDSDQLPASSAESKESKAQREDEPLQGTIHAGIVTHEKHRAS
jgi:hypothetical protein